MGPSETAVPREAHTGVVGGRLLSSLRVERVQHAPAPDAIRGQERITPGGSAIQGNRI